MDKNFKGLEESKDMLSFLEAALTSGTKKMASTKIKLVFIGDGGVGKTSILESFARDAMFFPGISIHYWPVMILFNPRKTQTCLLNMCH